MRVLSLCDVFASLSIRSSKSIHGAACVRISFILSLSNIPLYEQTTFCSSTHLLVGLHTVF